MPEPGRTPAYDDAEALRAAVQEGIDAAEAGRTIPYEVVRRWLLTWGMEDERSSPRGD